MRSSRYNYLRLARPIADAAPEIRKIIARRRIRFVVVDSWKLACGVTGQNDPADSAVRGFTALRTFGCTSLIVAHAPKEREGGRGLPDMYGSIFNVNLARSVVFVKRISDTSDAELRMSLQHTKVNDGPEHRPIGLAFTHDLSADGDLKAIKIRAYDLIAEPEAHRTISEKIVAVMLRARSKLRTRDIAGALDLKIDQVRSELNRLKERGKVESQPDSESKEKLWFLLYREAREGARQDA